MIWSSLHRKSRNSKNCILETERLYLREMTTADAEYVYLLNQDDEVIKYTGDPAFKDIESAWVFLEKYNHYKKYGFGRWAVIRKEDNEFLGWCGLKYQKSIDEYDIGFRFYKKYWKKGYATEAATACLEFGFRECKMPEIVGRAMLENSGSIRVLEKIGLVFKSYYDFDGEKGVLYCSI